MNKIQLEAVLQLAEIDCENNPTPVNKNRVAQAKAAFDAFLKAQEEPAEEPQKPAKVAAPKKATAPTPKKEKAVAATAEDAEKMDTEPTADNTASADRDTQAEPIEEKKTQE